MPVFVSFFIALRKMAYLPVPSLQTGGALWFTDLTLADPYYILPLAVTGTMFAILEVSVTTQTATGLTALLADSCHVFEGSGLREALGFSHLCMSLRNIKMVRYLETSKCLILVNLPQVPWET